MCSVQWGAAQQHCIRVQVLIQYGRSKVYSAVQYTSMCKGCTHKGGAKGGEGHPYWRHVRGVPPTFRQKGGGPSERGPPPDSNRKPKAQMEKIDCENREVQSTAFRKSRPHKPSGFTFHDSGLPVPQKSSFSTGFIRFSDTVKCLLRFIYKRNAF